MPRRKPRQLAQKVRFESAETEQVVEAVAEQQAESTTPRTELAKSICRPSLKLPLSRMKTATLVNLTVCRVALVALRATCA